MVEVTSMGGESPPRGAIIGMHAQSRPISGIVATTITGLEAHFVKNRTLTVADVEVLARIPAYVGYARVDRYQLRHRRYDGRWTDVISRELVERGHGVCVLPYDPARDQVVLIEQFRLGAYGAGLPPWQTEIISGVIEPGEAPELVARREAKEEAGCDLGEMVLVARMLTSSGILTETATVYCAKSDATQAAGIHGLAEEHEDIRAFAVPLAEAVEWVDTGSLQFAPAVAALGWLARHRDDLRRKWA
jgi:ADP-ribose pyrophosphatase